MLKSWADGPTIVAMYTPTSQLLLQRIDRLTGELNPAVGHAGGAQFALMLSMIYQAQQLVAGERLADASEQGGAGLYSHYTPELVGRLGQALQAGQRGELAMLVSWLDTYPARETMQHAEEVERDMPSTLAQSALLAKRYGLLEEIQQSQLSIAA